MPAAEVSPPGPPLPQPPGPPRLLGRCLPVRPSSWELPVASTKAAGRAPRPGRSSVSVPAPAGGAASPQSASRPAVALAVGAAGAQPAQAPPLAGAGGYVVSVRDPAATGPGRPAPPPAGTPGSPVLPGTRKMAWVLRGVRAVAAGEAPKPLTVNPA